MVVWWRFLLYECYLVKNVAWWCTVCRKTMTISRMTWSRSDTSPGSCARPSNVRQSLLYVHYTVDTYRLQTVTNAQFVHYTVHTYRLQSVTNAQFCLFMLLFLLLVRYVPNVAKRSIWDQCKKYILRTDWPVTDRPTAQWPTDRPTSHLGKFQMVISPRGVVRSTSCLVLRWVFEVGGSSDLLRVWF